MSNLKSIDFESFIPKEKFKGLNKSNKKIFLSSVKKIKLDIKKNKNVFHSFSKDFKLNFDIAELKKYKKYKRIVIIGLGGSILGTQAINFFLKKEVNKELIFVNNLDLNQLNKIKKFKTFSFHYNL